MMKIATLIITTALVFCVACVDNETDNTGIASTDNAETTTTETVDQNITVTDILTSIVDGTTTIVGTEQTTDASKIRNVEIGNSLTAAGCIEICWFHDSRTGMELEDGETVSDLGISGGGIIERYSTEEQASERSEYLDSLHGTVLGNDYVLSVYHEQHGVFIVRVSPDLSESERKEIFDLASGAFENLD